MKKDKLSLLACNDKYVYILARKLHKGDEVVNTPKTVSKSDWGFVDVFSTAKKAVKCLDKCVAASRTLKKKETYGILSIENNKLVLLKSENA